MNEKVSISNLVKSIETMMREFRMHHILCLCHSRSLDHSDRIYAENANRKSVKAWSGAQSQACCCNICVFSIILFHRIKPKSMPRRSEGYDGLELAIRKHDEVIIFPTCVGVKVHQDGDRKHTATIRYSQVEYNTEDIEPRIVVY